MWPAGRENFDLFALNKYLFTYVLLCSRENRKLKGQWSVDTLHTLGPFLVV